MSDGAADQEVSEGAANQAPTTEFHSHLANKSKQDAATTFEHMREELQGLKLANELEHVRLCQKNTDGCAKQYRCAKSVYFDSMLSSEFDLTIDAAIGAPGHGKDQVDGLNAVDKRTLRAAMCVKGTPEACDEQKLLAANKYYEEGGETHTTDLAEACKEILGAPERQFGVKSVQKSNKREENSNVDKRVYYVQREEDVTADGVKIKLVGLETGKFEGISSMYNIRTDPDLGPKRAMIRRFPCLCPGCVAKLLLPWEDGIDPQNQPRYQTPGACKFVQVFGDQNKWTFVRLEETTESNQEESNEIQQNVLTAFSTRVAANVEVEGFGALLTDDPDSEGFYIVQWTSEPYVLQEDTKLTEYDPVVTLPAGTQVCNARYWLQVSGATSWYVADTAETGLTVVRMQHVVHSTVSLIKLSDEHNPAPPHLNARQRQAMTDQKARRMEDGVLENILEEISKREPLDFEEADQAAPDDSGSVSGDSEDKRSDSHGED